MADILVTTHGIDLGHDAWAASPRRFLRMVPEGYDTSRAFIGYTWTYPHYARLMFTWHWKKKWHRLYFAFSWSVLSYAGWREACEFGSHETWKYPMDNNPPDEGIRAWPFVL